MRGPLAFPGAVGFGAGAKGGRGGRIIAVTTLADAGPGSYRSCVEAKGRRVCVFRVAGIIRFVAKPPIIGNPYLTVAGQTAPGGGITLAHSGGANGLTPLIIKKTHDIVIRHIRVRNDRIGTSRATEDSITIENSHDVVIDHVSASWARGEIVNPYGNNDNITISGSIFAEGISKHDECAVLGGDPDGPQQLSFIGNICAHNSDRNPGINFMPGSCIEIVNNVFYNAAGKFAEIWESYGGSPVAIVANVMRKGPSTSNHAIGLHREPIGSTGAAVIYAFGNRFDGSFDRLSPAMKEVSAITPPCPLTIAPMEAAQAFEAVLTGSGAFPRDDFDARIARDVREQTGHIVRTPGRIPATASGSPYPDRDADGMDDMWEATHAADPNRADPWEDADRDGTLNLDQFFADLDARRMAGAAPEPDPSPTPTPSNRKPPS